MSKPLAGYYGQKSINNNRSPQPKPQEYTVLGVNQPLIAPDSEQKALPQPQPSSSPEGDEPRKFWFSLLLNKLF
jgi:hypothetical protein